MANFGGENLDDVLAQNAASGQNESGPSNIERQREQGNDNDWLEKRKAEDEENQSKNMQNTIATSAKKALAEGEILEKAESSLVRNVVVGALGSFIGPQLLIIVPLVLLLLIGIGWCKSSLLHSASCAAGIHAFTFGLL